MRVVVKGREGQVVRSLAERASGTDVDIIALGRPQLDLTGSADVIAKTIVEARPDVVVSAAAYTQVDKAETEPDLAFAVNERGVRAVACGAREAGAPVSGAAAASRCNIQLSARPPSPPPACFKKSRRFARGK